MNNWRFLLLTFVAVFQPIAAYTERGLVDGRQQRCDYRTASLLRDPGVDFHGTFRFTKPAVADRHLNERANVREVRRNEVREGSPRTILPSERRLGDAFERGGHTPSQLGRFSRTEYRLTRHGAGLDRQARDAELSIEHRDERNLDVGRERLSSVYRTRQTNLDHHERSSKLSEDGNRFQSRIDSRRSSAPGFPMESRRDTQRHRDNTEMTRAQEIRETRIASARARDDITSSNYNARRDARERASRMDKRLSESRVQHNINPNREIMERRSKNTELRSSVSLREYRTCNNEDSRLANRGDSQSLDRVERYSSQSRRTLEHMQQRDSQRNRVTFDHNSVSAAASRLSSAEQGNIRESSDRAGNTRKILAHQAPENRRSFSSRDARLFEVNGFIENQREYRNSNKDNGLSRAKQFKENRISRDNRSDSRFSGRERSVENRRVMKATRSIERNIRSVRILENQMYSHSLDRAEVSDSLKAIRNIARGSQLTMLDRGSENKRDANNVARDSRGELDRESAPVVQGTFSINKRENPVERRSINRSFERITRVLTPERDGENRRTNRIVEKHSRTFGLERTDNRRVAHYFERESAILGRDRIAASQRNTRLNLADIRTIDKKLSPESRRDIRNVESRSVSVENNNRRDARNIGRELRSFERNVDIRRATRENERNNHTFGRKLSESRDTDTRKVARNMSERPLDIRNFNRQSRSIGEKSIIDNQGANRRIDRNSGSFRRERSAESQANHNRDVSSKTLERAAAKRRERAADNRKEIRNIEMGSRTFRVEEARGVESRITNMVRARDYHSIDRKSSRMTEHLNERDISLDTRRSHSAQRESRLASERNGLKTERRETGSRRLNTEVANKRDLLRSFTQSEKENSAMYWQYVFYTLQGLYICGILMQLTYDKRADMKIRAKSWWPAPQHLIKVD